ncbi:DUF4181 domain-containing protein [Bacillus sp. FJAT-45350]|uniref:DUF4181 domain-containing protein n=1 Tax=Bacillus sp. FJAT-45350 TaxID=2011014 RepID=UPI0015CBC8E0|nr:DUF4181 domain-containing protein [Bacillus sp. FJAT-45350]
MDVVIFFSLLTVIVVILSGISRLFLVRGEVTKVSETDGKKIERWGEGIIALTFVSLLFIIFDYQNLETLKWIFILYFIVSLSFQSVMEWKYLKGTKHLASLTIMVLSVIAIIGFFYATEAAKYTSFAELYSDNLNEHTVVKNISITINDLSENKKEPTATVTIDDKHMIQSILTDLSTIELKIHEDHYYNNTLKYTLSIDVKNPDKDKQNFFYRSSINLNIDQYSMSLLVTKYDIKTDTNHLSTIELLVDSQEVDWKYLND